MTIHRTCAGISAVAALALLWGCGQFAQARQSARLAHSAGGGPLFSYANPTASEMQKQEAAAPGSPAAGTEASRRYAQDYDETKAGGGEAASRAAFDTMADSQPDRYLIKNATLTVEAEDVRKATAALVQAVQAAKGYVSDMHEQSDGIGGLTATMQARVPYTAFDRSMQELSGLGKTLDKQVTAQDVTEEFVDTQAKVRNLKRTEARLLDHLSGTGKLSDTLLIEKELNRVRLEVEQLEGRVRFLSHRIAFSSISVTIQQKARLQALTPAASYSPAKESSEAVRSLVEFGRGILSMVIWVAVWTPVWLPMALVTYFVARVLYRRYLAAQAARPPRMTYGGYATSPQAPAAPGPVD